MSSSTHRAMGPQTRDPVLEVMKPINEWALVEEVEFPRHYQLALIDLCINNYPKVQSAAMRLLGAFVKVAAAADATKIEIMGERTAEQYANVMDVIFEEGGGKAATYCDVLLKAMRLLGNGGTDAYCRFQGKRNLQRFRDKIKGKVLLWHHPDIPKETMIRVDVQCSLFHDAVALKRDKSNQVIDTMESKNKMKSKGGICFHPMGYDWTLGGDKDMTLLLKHILYDVMVGHCVPTELDEDLVKELVLQPSDNQFMDISALLTCTGKGHNPSSRQDPHMDYAQKTLKLQSEKTIDNKIRNDAKKALLKHAKCVLYPMSFDMPLGKGKGMQLSSFIRKTKEVDESWPPITHVNGDYLVERRVHVPVGSLIIWRGDMIHSGAYPGIDNINDGAFRVHGYLPVYKSMAGGGSFAAEGHTIDMKGPYSRKMAVFTYDEAGRNWDDDPGY